MRTETTQFAWARRPAHRPRLASRTAHVRPPPTRTPSLGSGGRAGQCVEADAAVVRAFSRDGPKPLLGLVRRQKLGIDPALQASVLDLDPIPLPACSCEPRAPGGSPKNGRISGGCRPDVYAGTLQKDEIRVLRRGGSLGRHSTWSNLGRSLGGGEGSGNIGRRNHAGRFASWLRHSRSRLHRSLR
jgi:hypothetical protein